MLPSLPVKLTVNMSRSNIHISLLRGLCWQVRLNSPNVDWKTEEVCHSQVENWKWSAIFAETHFPFHFNHRWKEWIMIFLLIWHSLIANIWDWVGVTALIWKLPLIWGESGITPRLRARGADAERLASRVTGSDQSGQATLHQNLELSSSFRKQMEAHTHCYKKRALILWCYIFSMRGQSHRRNYISLFILCKI